MALSRVDVERFMVGGKSQKDAALYFGVTSRYIRKVLAAPLPISPASSPAVGPPPAVDWVRRPGDRGLHRVAVSPHNQAEQVEQAEQPALVPTGTTAIAASPRLVAYVPRPRRCAPPVAGYMDYLRDAWSPSFPLAVLLAVILILAVFQLHGLTF
jgi:hypothetical protein